MALQNTKPKDPATELEDSILDHIREDIERLIKIGYPVLAVSYDANKISFTFTDGKTVEIRITEIA